MPATAQIPLESDLRQYRCDSPVEQTDHRLVIEQSDAKIKRAMNQGDSLRVTMWFSRETGLQGNACYVAT